MSFYYNDAFENPDYHSSETLVVDRTRPSQSSTFPQHNPYDSYEEYGVEGRQGQIPPVEIPTQSVWTQSDAEYSPRDLAFKMPSSNPYGNAQINPSFEYEPEFAQVGHTARSALNDDYAPRPFDADDRANFIQRKNRQDIDTVFMTDSSQPQLNLGYNEERKKEDEKLINDLAIMSAGERIKAIKKIPKPMREKREIRNNAVKERTRKSHKHGTQMNSCAQCFYNTALSFRKFKNSLLDSFQLLKIWQKTLKDIGGKFGSGVLSYFVFLTWLLMFNTFSFLVNFSFLAIPQLIIAKPNNRSFTGLEFFTGAGYFQGTVLYYGFYSNTTVAKSSSLSPYYMQLAYIFTIGIYFIICFFSLLYSMAKSFRKNFVYPQIYSGNLAKLLCSWDFNITNEKAVKQRQENFSTQIKETLSEARTDALELSASQRISRFFIHLLAWLVALGTAAGACVGIFFFSLVNLELFLNGDKSELEDEAATLILPIVVSLLNHVLPFLYSSFGFVEKFTNPRHQIYTAIFRNVILKISIIGILCYYWLNRVAVEPKVECWETLVGQDIYRLLVADFICCLLGSFFGEFLLRIIGTTCCKQLGVPEFNIARNVLDLIYAQTLAWIGIFFSPLLPAIQMISVFIIFCVKKVSLMRNCQPPRKAWRASQMNTLFAFLLFFPSLVGVLSVIAVTVWRRKPSETCGPFRGLMTIFEAISSWMTILTSHPGSAWVIWIYHNLIESVLFFFILSIIVLIITYLYWQIIDGRKIMVKLLRQQIINEGHDKKFLLEKLRALQAPKVSNWRNQPERGPSLHRQPQQQTYLPLPNSTESSPRLKQRDSYAESDRIPEMISFFQVKEDSQSSRNAEVSEALALALRARQAAEWEMGDEESA